MPHHRTKPHRKWNSSKFRKKPQFRVPRELRWEPGAMGGWMWGGSDETDAIRTIHTALDSGINLIDTAPILRLWTFRRRSSARRLLLEARRKDNGPSPPRLDLIGPTGKPFRNASRARIVYEVEQSLPAACKTDVIDLYPQVHWPDPEYARSAEGRGCDGCHSTGPEKFAPIGRPAIFKPRSDGRVPCRSTAAHRSTRPTNLPSSAAIEQDVLPYCPRSQT